MAYVGKGPEQVLSGVASKYTFTGDGSTTTFDITTDIPAGGENDIQVFVDNVRQEPGSGASYTVGLDGSNNLRRITFNTAPEASQSIYVINPRRIEAVAGIGDNTVTTAKLQDTAVTTAKIYADAVTNAKIADEAISNEHFATTVITGQPDLGEAAASGDYILIYDTSAGVLKKIQRSNLIIEVPTLSSVSPTNVTTGDGTGNATFTITGTKFDATATAKLITTAGAEVSFDTVTRDSTTQITGVIAISSLSNDAEPYDVKVTNGSGLSVTLSDQISINAQPVFQTASGSVGSFQEQSTISTINIVAADPESAGNVTFEIISGSLPAGLSATTVNEDGVSKYRITGTLTTDVSSNTTSNFTLRAKDAASNTSTRAFSITETAYNAQSFTSSGTFSVPSGVTSVNVLVVAAGGGGGFDQGGGGGAGGLIYMPGYPVTPGGCVSVTVGCGGTGSNGGNTKGQSGQDSVFGTLTAKGGGGGGSGDCGGAHNQGAPGGSGGGTGWRGPNAYPGTPLVPTGGSATQPTQPGNSGTYGFGNSGGVGNAGSAGGCSGRSGGGGGGAGATGANGLTHPGPGGPGGAGRAYTIADGLTPVYYAGGGGGGGGQYSDITTAAQGGQGGGGNGGLCSPSVPNIAAQPGQANKGGGGGGHGTGNPPNIGGTGGKGIVIVSY